MINEKRSRTLVPLTGGEVMLKKLRAICLVTAGAVAFLAPNASGAASKPPAVKAAPGSDDDVLSYWTPERILNAKPADLVMQGKPQGGHPARSGNKSEPPQVFHGAAPTVPYDKSLATKLYDDTQQIHHAPPPLSGGGGYPYTTNRLYPVNDAVLHKIFPYATVGHLYFHEPSGDYQCSASVIRLSTIATAGHCVNDGSGHYYSKWLFIPGQNGSSAPFGKYTWSNAITTSAWYSGGGGVPNEQDDAVIVLKLRNGVAIGSYTGYLGYEYNTPLPTAISQLGYPCNLDSCSDPIATYSQDHSGPTNNFEWGTASFGGASGGPEVQDFGQAPSGVPNETLGGNIVISSTSYTYSSSTEVDGGSIFYAPGQNGEYTFGDDINYACSNGGC
jgi:V8-like Glu-specific endopeptidase